MRNGRRSLVRAALLISGAMGLPTGNTFAQSATPQAPRPRPAAASFEELAQRAAAARDAGRVDEAIGLYERAVKLRPAWDEGLWFLGTLHYEKDRYDAARDAFQRFVVLKPDAGMGWALLGLCEYRLRAYDAALDHLQRASQLGLPGGAEVVRAVRLHLGLLYNRKGESELALSVLASLTAAKSPPSRDVCEALGLSLLRWPVVPSEVAEDKRPLVLAMGRAGWSQLAGETEDASKRYAELRALFPSDANVLYAYAVFQLSERKEQAADLFRNVLALDPQHVFARLHLAHLLLQRGEAAEALPLAEEAVKLEPDLPAAHHALGRVLVETGQVDAAIAELEMGIRLAPDSPEMHFALARAYTKAGRSDAAERTMARFKELEARARALRGEPPETPLRGAAPQR
jgi:tetratricopeptide (TPR) repeat protein